MTNKMDIDGPSTHSERLKTEYSPVMCALYRSMSGFAPGGTNGGISEVAGLVNKSSALLRNQYGPTAYDHAPTLHGFLQMIEVLKSVEAVNEIARLADAVAIPASPKVGAPEADQDAVRCFLDRTSAHAGSMIQRLEAGRLSATDRAACRAELFDIIAFASHLLTRFDPTLFDQQPRESIEVAPTPPGVEVAASREKSRGDPDRGPSAIDMHKGTESLVLGVVSGD